MTQKELYHANKHRTSHTGNVGAGNVGAGNVGAGSSTPPPPPPAPEPEPAPTLDPSGDGEDVV